MQAPFLHRARLRPWVLPLLVVLVLACAAVSIMVGRYGVSPQEMVGAIGARITGGVSPDRRADSVVFNLRMPRITVAILIGSAAIPLGVPGAAFLGAILATLAVLMLAGIHRRVSTVKLVLAGAAISALCVAATNFIVYMSADAEGMQSAAFWTMGSLADAKWHSLFLPVLIVTTLAVYFLSQLRTLDVLLLGEELAVTLGIDASAKRRLYMGLLALLTGVLVATCGIIGFVGLVVPHLVRAFTGASHRRLLPTALLVGAIFLVVADLLARTLLPAGDLPIGIITALIGAPLFMKLLFGSSENFGGGR